MSAVKYLPLFCIAITTTQLSLRLPSCSVCYFKQCLIIIWLIFLLNNRKQKKMQRCISSQSTKITERLSHARSHKFSWQTITQINITKLEEKRGPPLKEVKRPTKHLKSHIRNWCCRVTKEDLDPRYQCSQVHYPDSLQPMKKRKPPMRRKKTGSCDRSGCWRFVAGCY